MSANHPADGRRRAAILREMGLAPLWKLRAAAAETTPEPQAAPLQIAAQPDMIEASASGSERLVAIAAMDWTALRASIAECRACALCQQRKQAVPGVGDPSADWLFVGEGPGAEEDERGEPFVGQAGKLLDAMLAAIGLRRGEDVYIANAVKCRPPGNRTPAVEEMAACRPYLERQIELLQPKLIVALGRPAAQTLLQSEVKISASRGRLFKFHDIPLIVTYHPAYLLRTLSDKAKAWEDLCLALRTMRDLKSG
jgi:DNA polymerase